MSRRLGMLLLASAALCLQSGCGTFVNMKAPPQPGPPGIGPTACSPFGGVLRSGLLGGFCLAAGPTGSFSDIGNGSLLHGAYLTAVGAYALFVDVPLSLVGDVATLPIAIARSRGAPWASWWGERYEPSVGVNQIAPNYPGLAPAADDPPPPADPPASRESP